MNTGIQDAWSLGWKLAMVLQGRADAQILESHHGERWPVGRTLLRATDRLFGAFAESVSGSTLFMLLRRVMVRGWWHLRCLAQGFEPSTSTLSRNLD